MKNYLDEIVKSVFRNLLIVLYNLNVNLGGKLLQWAVNINNGAAIYLECQIIRHVRTFLAIEYFMSKRNYLFGFQDVCY